MDAVLCRFGLKTLSPDQQRRFSRKTAQVLRPGGRCSMVEVSVPPQRLLRVPDLSCLAHAILVLGRLLLRDRRQGASNPGLSVSPGTHLRGQYR